METKITPAEETVGIYLASGFTKKEIASICKKSERTIGRQADDLYKKTGSRNLSDITRFMVRRYKSVDGLLNAVQDIAVLGLIVGMIYTAFTTNEIRWMDELKTSVFSLFKSVF